MAPTPIRVLVVDDSLVARTFVAALIMEDPAFQVVGTARNGYDALATVEALRPDVIAMDYHMPEMNGLQATRALMAWHPTPIVVVCGCLPEDIEVFEVLKAGALAVVRRPAAYDDPDHERQKKLLLSTLKTISEVRLVRRAALSRVASPRATSRRPRLVAIAASTGGPAVLETILSHLPADFPLPIAIVQHITPDFLPGLLRWLGNSTPLSVKAAENGERLRPGGVYFAPDGKHLAVEDDVARLSLGPAQDGHLPSASHLFHAVAQSYAARAIGILLTGMGQDGAAGLHAMFSAGAPTLAQRQDTCAVYGMPARAAQLGAVRRFLAPEEFAPVLVELAAGVELPDLPLAASPAPSQGAQ